MTILYSGQLRDSLWMEKIRKILPERSLVQSEKISYREGEKWLNFPNRSNKKEYCETASVNPEAVLINTAQLHIKININDKMGKTMIDFGATRNFIIKKYMKTKRYPI